MCLKLTLPAHTIVAWRHSGNQPEDSGEVRLAGEAGLQSDLSDGRVGTDESLTSCLDAKLANVLPNAASVTPSKLAGEMDWMYAGVFCQVLHSQSPVVIGMSGVSRLLEPARKRTLPMRCMSTKPAGNFEHDPLDCKRSNRVGDFVLSVKPYAKPLNLSTLSADRLVETRPVLSHVNRPCIRHLNDQTVGASAAEAVSMYLSSGSKGKASCVEVQFGCP
jgi:hypothetical protein